LISVATIISVLLQTTDVTVCDHPSPAKRGRVTAVGGRVGASLPDLFSLFCKYPHATASREYPTRRPPEIGCFRFRPFKYCRSRASPTSVGGTLPLQGRDVGRRGEFKDGLLARQRVTNTQVPVNLVGLRLRPNPIYELRGATNAWISPETNIARGRPASSPSGSRNGLAARGLGRFDRILRSPARAGSYRPCSPKVGSRARRL
jgi:hypothetical protein